MNKYNQAVEKYKKLILDAEQYIWQNPETGFKEYKTSQYLENSFKDLGYTTVSASDISGFYTVIDTKKQGPEVLILAEMDALICREHPDCDKNSGAVHCCGHNAQCAAILGIAAALKEPGILDRLCGKIRLCAVPGEELIELEYRASLKEKGIIKYFGGKSEFLRRGYFDGVDIAFMVHTTGGDKIYINKGSVGCIAKKVIYKGRSAHAAGAWDGCNALYAATLGLNAVNALRETFKEADLIRVHPIITNGGDAVNAIPDNVTLESYVRGISFDAIKSANNKVNKALCGAALSMGANVEICDIPGYSPLSNSDDMMNVAKEAASNLKNIEAVMDNNIGCGCSDMGDLSGLMPVVHPHIPGSVGTGHGADYKISNPELACVESAKWQLYMLHILLSNNAERANGIIRNFKPLFNSKEQYFEYIDKFISSGNRITYDEDTATVKF